MSHCIFLCKLFCLLFFFNDTATTEIYTLSLHDALPISRRGWTRDCSSGTTRSVISAARSEEHTSELQSPYDHVCRLLLEKKKRTFFYQLFSTAKRLLDEHQIPASAN